MKILHYINNLGSGGAEKLLTDILPAMKAEGHQVCVVISNSANNFEKYEDLLKRSNIDIYDLRTSFYNPTQVFKLIKLIKQKKIEIVHAHLFPTQYWLAIASMFFSNTVKLVKTEHNAHNNRRSRKSLRILEKFIYSKYSLIIAITEKVKQNLAAWIGENYPIEVIKNGVNLKQIEDEIHAGTGLDIDPEKYNILMVGSFDGRQKDQTSLISSLKYLPRNVSIYFVGKGPRLEDSKNEVAQLDYKDQIEFLEHRKDVYALMGSVDLNVLSTNYEGLSGVALEAMASGKPFIGSNVEGVQEIVPSASFLFPPKNPQALAKKILEIKNDSKIGKKMVSESLNHVKSYDTQLMVSEYLRIYQEVLS